MTDWAADVKKHVSKADEEAIQGIINYCGIALRNADSSLVSFKDPEERGRVRDNFMKKKLALTDSDDKLEAIIDDVAAKLKGSNRNNRVTVYYLIAEKLGKLDTFHKKSK